MKQTQYSPMSVAEMGLSLYAVNSGFYDKVPKDKVVNAEAQLLSFAKTNASALLKSINEKPDLSKDVEAALKKVCEDFFSTASF
jgi:F-type H+-transporting ATPase subunit alpha